ncbi:alpha/beta hydrolase [Phenylobacterium sp.]|jgi:acetyl esterase/lipase|uniref:alpha/beta hydrolase n=1 Tax=Phenylobacterium sp. TaxID=1871053 RepID=UPI002E2FB4B1|nr:alpha/beta hydrolase [Phenylobacterium sp.]HEX2558532.1 alpha/beta hydrolase [Phenylobacterium sp.]
MTSRSEIVFAQAGGRDLRLDLFRPDGEPRAIILMVHGGGWRRGSREGIAAYGRVFARLGFVTVAAEYRLLDEAPWPAQLDDVEAAVMWAARNTDNLGAPAGRMALLGFSAGGHLALLAADDLKDQVAAVIALFPPVELVTDTPSAAQTAASKLLDDGATEDAARLASPLHRAGPNFPPTFLIHGAEDWVVPHATSQAMFEALSSAGVKVELHIYAGHTHEFADAPYMMESVAAEVANFLHRMVVDPAGARQEDLKHNSFARNAQARR